ncbi:MAG: DUF2752 domain-containing protein [Acidobacteria bacterium]|nr:MAG: DUF2752 domain-containing protein [Acidobacteriota bacterium]
MTYRHNPVRPHILDPVITVLRRDRLIIAAPFIGVALLALFTPSDDGPTFCPFALCTGTACPGCGMTRAASHLVRGDIGTAITYHPLIPLIAAQLLGGWVWFMLRRSGRVSPMSPKTLNVVLFGTAAALLAVWAIRMVTGTLPAV